MVTTMKLSFMPVGIRILVVALAAHVALSAAFAAPGQRGGPAQMGAPPPVATGTKLDPAEEKAYKAFYTANQQDADTRITLGEAFIVKFPSSRYDESVYAGLVQAYYAKQDWKNFYGNADKALALNPDDVGVLAIVGWMIPHAYNPDDPDALKNLDKAETYEKHAIEVVGTLVKPATMTDDQFAAMKTERLTLAHSGLGLVYFRRQDFDNAVKELQQATQGAASPDPTDFYVLAVSLQRLNRQSDAGDAFNSCAQIAGPLQDRCKQGADAAKKQGTPSK
jgi:tetratricopeptide (TPR) repeat protein